MDPQITLATPPPVTQDYFNHVVSLKTTKQLHDLITQNQDKFSVSTFVDDIRYQGFERTTFLVAAIVRVTPSQLLRLALIGAIRGANFDKIVKSSQKVDDDLVELVKTNTVVRKASGPKDITVLRCTASIPQWCAYFLGKAGVPKKLAGLECPAALQFPAAASLPMSKAIRLQHVKFSIHFSRTIKGAFNENIYLTMMSNTIPDNEIPDELKLVLGTADYTVDVQPMIEEIRKELGLEVVKAK